jgi:phosphohistidine phosphatase SixA
VIVIVTRHADKEAGADGTPASDDPPLSGAGRARARLLARMVAPAHVSAAFHSDARRTRETAQRIRTALGNGLELVEVPFAGGTVPQQIARTAALVLARPRESTVLVIGHSDTVGPILERLGSPPVGDLADEAFDDLFVLTRPSSDAVVLVRMKYGAATPRSP